MRILRLVGYKNALASANFLCRVLKENRRWDMIIDLQRSLLEIFPGSPHILLALAEAELNAGHKEGQHTLEQVLLIDSTLSNEVERLKSCFAPQETLELPLGLDLPLDEDVRPNALGLSSCILVDPDTTVHQAVRQSLKAAGIQNLETFESGLSAWNWLNQGGRPALILMEWRIPELNALQLIQRINQHAPGVPIIILSSLISPSEISLLKEMGVRGMVEKPFETQNLMAEIVTVIQQHRYPTEQQAMDRRIMHCLATNNEAEATHLLTMYLNNPLFEQTGKWHMEAELAFFKGRFKQCCNLAFEALKRRDDSLELLNLLAKALMRLGDFENALKLLEKANTLAPRNIERICRMATICNEMNRKEDAENWLSEARNIDAVNILVTETEAAMAIEGSDSARAAVAIKRLENLNRIVAYTNNKAVALIRNNQLQQGINLYKTALDAMPEPWNAIHDTICFNLGLAYIRFVQYQEARDILRRIKADPASTTGQRVSALIAKLDHAMRTQTHLQFASDSGHENHPKVEETVALDLEHMMDSFIPIRGDICCYRIFQAQDLATESVRKHLQNMPKLVQRPPMRRTESMPYKLDRSNAS
jgi:DNA-binding NarL/FixJ family response regulator/thioredoxin-like negative regulator of GroEL